MKTLTQSLVVTFSAALMLAFASTTVRSENGAKGGAAGLMASKPAPAMTATASHRMDCPMTQSCPECRTVTKTATVTEGKGNVTKTLPISTHLCPMCKTSISTTGHGKAATSVSTHVCAKADGKASSCCAN